AVHAEGRGLHRQAGAITSDGEPRKQIAFAEDQPAGLPGVVEVAAVSDRLGDAAPQERRVRRLVPAACQESDGDARRGVVVAARQESAAVIDYFDGVSGREAVVGLLNLAGVHREMAGLQAPGPALGYGAVAAARRT